MCAFIHFVITVNNVCVFYSLCTNDSSNISISHNTELVNHTNIKLPSLRSICLYHVGQFLLMGSIMCASAQVCADDGYLDHIL